MATAEQNLHQSRRRVYAVRKLRTADRFWRHPELAGDVVLAVLALYVVYVLATMVVTLP
jgi:hypothetical protein